MTEGTCAIWGTRLKSWRAISGGPNPSEVYDSPRAGGHYQGAMYLMSSLKSQDNEFKAKLTTWLVDQRLAGNLCPNLTEKVINEDIDKRPLLSTTQRLNKFFRYCAKYKNRFGQELFTSKPLADMMGYLAIDEDNILKSYVEIIDESDLTNFISLLIEEGFFAFQKLTYKAFERIDSLENVNVDLKQAFVAMWFDPSLNDSYENAIEPAIREAGYEPRIIRKVEHNNKIDDEIIAEIRRSKFVIADFTCGFSKEGAEAIARGGVYYEAGFAQGLGLPVIWTCREDIINHVHFDTRQYNHIVWKNAADLKEKLLNRIRATIT